ncbi:hypothetical protein GRI97_05850 [Altererythrobacter xixiisoli]|uniref:Lectin-like protein BA14k n=1 Tax=Croceibacterium xixiisoli TaxID=1476466 RepID=A0A6I4TTG5_9SPHN|nr:hypothetical protein [Croceibacterium xixiisoli]MXO98510.1 hypothetical protein [Croceibacterium xixiisoli]
MTSRTGRWLSITAAVTLAFPVAPIAAPAHAQSWGNASSCWSREGRDRERCERDQQRRNREEAERNRSRDRDRNRERDRRNDAKTDGIVIGVVGAAVLAGVIAAATSGNRNDREKRDRRNYCMERYGNYDERSDSYRARDGRWYRCE